VWLLPAVGFLRFLNLGFTDLQAWDEALYAVRAEAVVRFGAWIDQTPYAIDGLYSSLHPPLHVWMTAVSFLLLGVDEFSSRCVSALAGAVTLLVLYEIGKELHSRRLGVLAALIFGLNPFVTFFARQGQFDTTLVLFLSLTLFFSLRLLRTGRRGYALGAGTALGCALMTKAYVGLGLPLAVLLARWMVPRDQRDRLRFFVFSFFVAAAVALPWYLFMQVRHGGTDLLFFFRQSELLQRSLYGIEGNVKPLEVFYFVNQLLVQFSFGTVWFIVGAYDFFRERKLEWMLPLAWFIVFFVVFSIMRTKLAVYILPMLVPISLLAAYGLLEFPFREFRPSTVFIILLATGASLLWSASQSLRNFVKDALQALLALRFPPSDVLIALVVPAVILVLIALGMLLVAQRISPARTQMILIPVLLAVWGVVSLADILVLDRYQYRDGAAEFARFLQSHNASSLIVAGYERNPQLTYYLRGADIGWRGDLQVRRIIPPRDSVRYREWLERETYGEPPNTLVVFEKDKFVRYRTVVPERFVPEGWRRVFRSRRYEVYRPEFSSDVAGIPAPSPIHGETTISCGIDRACVCPRPDAFLTIINRLSYIWPGSST
jgi:4-amino-4-deoxy-L-arabinose transferase-like glycosyltransferase